MLFVFSKLAEFIVKPDTLLLLPAVLILIVAGARWRRWGRAIAWLWALMIVTLCALPIDNWALAPLEDRFPPVREMPAHLDGIIVLGGVVDPILTSAHGMPALNDMAERLTEFAKLARRYPDAKLIFTGGSNSLDPSVAHEADQVKPMLADLGVDTSRVIFERESRTTWENAIDSKPLANPQSGQVWALITSANHMPRSVGCFRAAGWPVLAWPVAYKSGDYRIFAPGRELEDLDLAMHEWLGLAGYWVLGRTDALFPAP